jgi:formylmethanofuran dehydrogenase subunit E
MPKPMGELQEKRKNQLTSAEQKELEGLRESYIQYILNASDNELLSIRSVNLPEPEKARIYPTLMCEECKERFMEI